MFVDLFDSVGTIMACANEAGMVKEDGKIEKVGKILEADAIATVAGALLGTSTTTTYVESSSGIAAGARTGLAAIVTGLLFLLATLFTPIIGVVPTFATAPALIMVGVYMFRNINCGFVVYENSEVIPGVTSFSNASAKVKKPLCVGDGSFSIVPLHKENVVNTTVFMRPKIGMQTNNIPQKGTIYTFENLNFRGETIHKNKKEKVDKYMTLFIDFVQ